MGFLSRIVADARVPAPVVSATAPAVERSQGAAEGWEIVEVAFSPESMQTPSSPSPAAQSLSPPSR